MKKNPLYEINPKEVEKTLQERKKELAEGLEQYIYLIKRLQTEENAPLCEKFQKVYDEFFKLKRKTRDFRNTYYGLMQEYKRSSERLNLETVLERLSDKKIIKNKSIKTVEPSFGSKLLSMLYQETMPPWDRNVQEVLKTVEEKIKAPSYYKLKKSRKAYISDWNTFYTTLCVWYVEFADSPKGKEWIKLFNDHYHEAENKVTEVKKIDLILWQMGAQIIDQKKKDRKANEIQ